MKNLAAIMCFCLGILLFCCGCETYLGYHYDELPPEVRETAKSRNEKAQFWQYELHGKDLKLYHSVLSEVRYDVARNFRRRRVETYADVHHKDKSYVRQAFETEPVFTAAVIAPIILCGDLLRCLGHSLLSVGYVWRHKWNLDEYSPNILYMLGYMPVFGQLNPFMEAPYMYDHLPWWIRKVSTDRIDVYRTTHNDVLREVESLQKSDRKCVLQVNDVKFEFSVGDSGITEIDLRQRWGGRSLLPESAMRLTLSYGGEKVIDLKLKSTQLLDGEELYLWQLLQDETANSDVRLKAFLVLRRQGVLASEAPETDAILKSLLKVGRFGESIKQ